MTPRGVNRVIVGVRDIQKSKKFYEVRAGRVQTIPGDEALRKVRDAVRR